ncbi:reverse transcriptase domain-containing protein [Tanacetum coccineum]
MRDIVRLKTERELVRITIDGGNAFWKEIKVDAEKVLDLEKSKTAQAKEIASLKKRSSNWKEKKGSEDRIPISGREIMILMLMRSDFGDETQEMNMDKLMFDKDVLEEQENKLLKGSLKSKQLKPIVLNLLLLQPTYTRPKARGVVVQEPSEFKTTSPPLQASQLPQKDQVALDEEMARNLEAQMQAELIEEERLARQKDKEANIALIESWDNTQLKSKSYDEIQKLFDKEMKRSNTFMDMESEVSERCETQEQRKVLKEQGMNLSLISQRSRR